MSLEKSCPQRSFKRRKKKEGKRRKLKHNDLNVRNMDV